MYVWQPSVLMGRWRVLLLLCPPALSPGPFLFTQSYEGCFRDMNALKHFCPPGGSLLGYGLPRFMVYMCQWQVFLADVFKAQAGVTYFFHTSCQLTVKQCSRNALRAHFADMTQPRRRLSLRIECTLSIWLRLSTSTLVILSCHLMCRILRKHRKWKLLSCFVCLTLYI